MAMSLVGNITYINQNSLSQATQFANAQMRPDFLQDANLNEYERKLKEVQEVKPAQSAPAIDPDGQNKQEFEQNSDKSSQQQAKKGGDSENSESEIDFKNIHDGMLDIRV